MKTVSPVKISHLRNDQGFYASVFGALAALTDDKIIWHTCREEYHGTINSWRKNDQYKKFSGICAISLNGISDISNEKPVLADLVDFFNIIEEQLKLSKPEKAIFQLTDQPDKVHITFGPFWDRPMIRTLITALLRCAIHHKIGRDFKTALYCKDYTSETRKALARFLEGYTVYKGENPESCMWHSYFYPCDTSYHSYKNRLEWLVKP